jgi:Uri superfamily endonuclease
MSDSPALQTARALMEAAQLNGQWVGFGECDALADCKGAYVLLVRLDKALPVGPGRTRTGSVPAGTYLYAGSAYGAGGLAARLRRHFRSDKTIHWHIDRLTLEARELAAFAVENGEECQLIQALSKMDGVSVALDGFGSTDCVRCRSHLLRIG